MEQAVNRLFDFFEELRSHASWRSVFGEPQSRGDRMIIPVSAVAYGAMLGAGGAAGAEEVSSASAPGGAGGAGRLHARPVAIIEISPEGVAVRPTFDVALLALAGMFTVAWIVTLWASVLRKFLSMRESQRE